MCCTYALAKHEISFISCFASAKCSHHWQHRQYQADMKIHSKHASACCGPRVDCSYYSIFHVIGIFWKQWHINFIFNIPLQEKITHCDVWGSGRPSAKSNVSSTSINPLLGHVFFQISSNPKVPMG